MLDPTLSQSSSACVSDASPFGPFCTHRTGIHKHTHTQWHQEWRLSASFVSIFLRAALTRSCGHEEGKRGTHTYAAASLRSKHSPDAPKRDLSLRICRQLSPGLGFPRWIDSKCGSLSLHLLRAKQSYSKIRDTQTSCLPLARISATCGAFSLILTLLLCAVVRAFLLLQIKRGDAREGCVCN